MRNIFLRAIDDLQLSGYYDYDWGTCLLFRRSLIGYFVTLGNSLISWRTKKQAAVFMSSAECHGQESHIGKSDGRVMGL